MTFEGTDFKPIKDHLKIENGFYLTIRCGLPGIYTMVNEWRDGYWMIEVADDSRTVAYSKNRLTLKSIPNKE